MLNSFQISNFGHQFPQIGQQGILLGEVSS